MEVDGTTDTVNIISIAAICIGLVVNVAIAFIAYRGMHHSKTDPKFKVLFVLSWLTTCFASIACIIGNALEMRTDFFPYVVLVISTTAIWLFFVLLLMTLVLRLRMTFNDSIYQMSQCTYFVFIAILCILFAVTCTGPAFVHLPVLTIPIFFFFFFMGSALAVYFFVSNLSKLAKSRRNTLSKMNISETDISLDRSQQKMMDLAARYLLLYGVATLSSMMFTVGCLFLLGQHVLDITITIDCSINLICMYLQFGFAKNHYQRCCGCMDRLCRGAITKRTKSSIHKLSVERVRSRSTAESASCATPSFSPSPSTEGGKTKEDTRDQETTAV